MSENENKEKQYQDKVKEQKQDQVREKFNNFDPKRTEKAREESDLKKLIDKTGGDNKD